MLPSIDGAVIGITIVMAMMAFGAVGLCLFFVGLALRKRTTGAGAFVAGVFPLFIFSLWLHYRLSFREVSSLLADWIIVLFITPAVVGLISTLISLRGWKDPGINRLHLAMRCIAIVAGALLLAQVAMLWHAMVTRRHLYQAVLTEDVATVRTLVSRGAARHKKDEVYRQYLLHLAARSVNDEIITLLIGAKANPSVSSYGKLALIEALYADPTMRFVRMDPALHRAKKLRTIKLLLDHGADPNLGYEGVSPARLAWYAADPVLLAMLKHSGARDADTVGPSFEALLKAAESGDAVTVKAIVSQPGGAIQQDSLARRPLLVASEHGHLPVVNVLLDAYGGSVQCWLIEMSMDAAARNQHVAVFNRMLPLCFNPYDGSAVVSAARAGSVEMLKAAFAAQRPIADQKALDAAVAGGHRDVVRALLAAGATVDPERMPATEDAEIKEMLRTAKRRE